MKKSYFILISMLVLWGSGAYSHRPGLSKDHVTLDFNMVDAGIDWLELIRSGADELRIKAYFEEHIVPTQGCQTIIHHWARFRKWDAEELYAFIMTALDRVPSEEKLEKEDGSLTFFGMRRKLWHTALRDTSRLRNDLNTLKSSDLLRSVAVVRSFLPPDAVLDVKFSFVLFGHSSAFSVGRENGFDFLQLPRKTDDSLDIDQIVQILAHELHHSGFASMDEKYLNDIKDRDRLMLLGILAAEGMPTYFIDKPQEHLAAYRDSRDPLRRMVAADWEKHSARLPELYLRAEADLNANLEGGLSQDDLMHIWMAGAKGPAYILGGDMIRVIDTYLGREAAVSVAADYRKLLRMYNHAARQAHAQGKKPYLFSESLADRIAGFGAPD